MSLRHWTGNSLAKLGQLSSPAAIPFVPVCKVHLSGCWMYWQTCSLQGVKDCYPEGVPSNHCMFNESHHLVDQGHQSIGILEEC